VSADIGTGQLRAVDALRAAWAYAIAVIVAAMFGICLIFQEDVAGAVKVWIGSATYNHCFLILPIALYMIWQRRADVALLAPKPELRGLALIVLFSFAWLAASVFDVLEARQFMILSMIQGVLFCVLGSNIYRRLLAPFLYLYFLVPSGEFLVPSLQDFTARFSVLGLQLLGIPVFSDGVFIEVPAGQFEVAEACAGLRFLIAAIAFGVFYATEIYQSRSRRVAFIALSIVVPIIANGFRALGLIAAAEAFGSAAAIEADHVTYGWIFFSLVLVALIFIGRTFSDRDPNELSSATLKLGQGPPAPSRALALAGGLAVLLAAFGPAAGAVLDGSMMAASLPLAAPSVAPPWQKISKTADWRPVVISPGREFAESFTSEAGPVDRFIALYPYGGRESNLIRSENRISNSDVWPVVSRKTTLAHIAGKKIAVNSAIIASGAKRQLVWWFYALDGTATASLANVKLHQARAYFRRDACPSALIAAASDASNPEAATQALDAFFGAMENPATYLCRSPPPR
jgi:exosortase A